MKKRTKVTLGLGVIAAGVTAFLYLKDKTKEPMESYSVDFPEDEYEEVSDEETTEEDNSDNTI